MRMFQNCLEACKEVERDLWELGVTVKGEKVQSKDVGKEGWTKELISYVYSVPLTSFMLRDLKSLLEWAKFPPADYDRLTAYVAQEYSDRILANMGSANPGIAYTYRKDYWEKYLAEGKFDYTYAERMHPQLDRITKHMAQEPRTRQALLSIWDSKKDPYRIGEKRVPCSIYYHFMVREVEDRPVLNLIYNMRSCDFYTHFIFDQALAILMGAYMAVQLGVLPGRLFHQMNSLHAYYGDLEKRGIF